MAKDIFLSWHQMVHVDMELIYFLLPCHTWIYLLTFVKGSWGLEVDSGMKNSKLIYTLDLPEFESPVCWINNCKSMCQYSSVNFISKF